MQVLAAHCLLKQSLDIVASPGTMLAPALSTDREQQQQQHILVPASAKDALAQHHAHHCSVCGAARHTHQASTHIRAHTHTYAYTHTHAHTYTHTDTNARDYSQACTRTYTCTRTNTQTHARAHIQTPKHTGIHTRTHAYAYACTRCARDGLRQFFCQLGSKFRQVAGTETNTQEGKKF